MADRSTIQWTDATWNPVRGCSKVSEGCRFCYAMLVAARFSGPGLAYEGLGKMTSAGPAWTGKVRTVPKHLDDPLRWSRPRRIFVNSMSDLFHEALPIEAIAEVFAVMYLAPRHTFQVLTKRAERMREVLTSPHFYNLVLRAAEPLRHAFPKINVGISDPTKLPAPWVHLGVSVESPDHLERLTELHNTPAGLRFASFEPLLGDLGNIRPWLYGHASLDWVIVGGESHPGGKARPFDLAWARSIVAQCRAAVVPAFVKQLGAWPFDSALPEVAVARSRLFLDDGHGGDPAEWPLDLRVREFPEVRRG